MDDELISDETDSPVSRALIAGKSGGNRARHPVGESLTRERVAGSGATDPDLAGHS